MKLRSMLLGAIALVSVSAHAQLDISNAQAKQAGWYEVNDCRVPTALTFTRELRWASNWPVRSMSRYVQYAGEPVYRMSTPNPEGVSTHGAGHYTNCTPGADPYNKYQYLIFKLRGTGYFSTAGDHIPVLTRAVFSGMLPGSEAYDAIGVIFDPKVSVLAERFVFPPPGAIENDHQLLHPQMPMTDGVTYTVLIHSAPNGMTYEVFDDRGNHANAKNGFYQNPLAMVFNSGLGFGVLCKETNGACTDFGGEDFRVDIWDIQSGWFAP